MIQYYNDILGDINLSLTKKPKSIEKLAKFNNNKAFQFWFSILVQRALNRYSFRDLPDTVNERVLKLSLLYHAAVCFFDEQGHLMALPGASGTNGVTVYGDYTYSIVYGRNGWTKTVPLWLEGEKDLKFISESYIPAGESQKPSGVWFRENERKIPFIDKCIEYAEQIADSWVKMENIRAFVPIPFAVEGIEPDNEGFARVYQQVVGNVPYIFVTRKIKEAEIALDPFDTNAEKLKQITDHIDYLLAQFNALCGMRTNSNPDKMSGMSDVEVMAGTQVIDGDILATCDYIQHGLDQVNYHFGTNIRVVPGRGAAANDAEQDGGGMVPDAGPCEVGYDRRAE